MANLNVKICGVDFKNPIIAASGAFGFGREYNKLYDINVLGGVSTKGTTLNKRAGNPPPRVAETPSGMLNSVGLQNPGSDYVIENELPFLRKQGVTIIANLAGSCKEEYIQVVQKVSNADIDMVELNISCPNVKEGGLAFGASEKSIDDIVSSVKKVCNKPLIVKLSPNVTSITDMAKAAQNAGADAISLINTLLGMKIDIKSRRPILKNNVGGLSGPAIFPVALRMVWQVKNAVDIPVIGMGGVSSASDVIEMMLAGASAVNIGAALFNEPKLPLKIIEDLNKYLDDNNIENISDLTGKVIPW